MNTVSGHEITESYALYHGDCVRVLSGLPDNSIDFGIHSPPFKGLYIYSSADADMGNCNDDAEFFEHYRYAIRDMLRTTVPGRLCAVHCKDLPQYRGRDGASGLQDFPGEICAAFCKEGWVFHSRVTIWKCPVTERERTNNNGLLHKTVKRDSSQLRQGMADYVLVFRKPPAGESNLSDKPIERPKGFTAYVGTSDPRTSDVHPSPYARTGHASDESIDIWRRYAEPVWWDIDQTDVLNCELAREAKDEKHICPLQLGVIERSIALWTNPGDVVFSPFVGIGSEGYVSIKAGRKFVGSELKESYFRQAVKNLNKAVSETNEQVLFSEE